MLFCFRNYEKIRIYFAFGRKAKCRFNRKKANTVTKNKNEM